MKMLPLIKAPDHKSFQLLDKDMNTVAFDNSFILLGSETMQTNFSNLITYRQNRISLSLQRNSIPSSARYILTEDFTILPIASSKETVSLDIIHNRLRNLDGVSTSSISTTLSTDPIVKNSNFQWSTENPNGPAHQPTILQVKISIPVLIAPSLDESPTLEFYRAAGGTSLPIRIRSLSPKYYIDGLLCRSRFKTSRRIGICRIDSGQPIFMSDFNFQFQKY
jgi:hypothetical protein